MLGGWRSAANRGLVLAGVIGAFFVTNARAADDPYATAPAYLKPVTARASVRPLLTVGQLIPLARGAAGERYRFVGVPDGLGVYALADSLGMPWEQGVEWESSEDARDGAAVGVDTTSVESPALEKQRPKPNPFAALQGDPRPRMVLLVNHELAHDKGRPVGPLPGGARISEITFEWIQPKYLPPPLAKPKPRPIAARPAIERVFVGEEGRLLDPVERPISKLCSAYLATAQVGFDPPMFLTGEEDRGSKTFGGRGGSAFAVFSGNAYTLPHVGRAEWENLVVAPFTGLRTVLFGLEDGPSDGDGLHSQLYLYVGEKQPESKDPLVRNGLRGGNLYVLASRDPSRASEAGMKSRGDSVQVHWVRMEWDQDDKDLDRAAKEAGAFNFVRLEDGACDPRLPGNFYFATTGKLESANPYGRFYRLRFDPGRPLEDATLTLLLDGSEGVVGPDNIDVNRRGQIALQEDPGDALLASGQRRDSSIWIYEIATGKLIRIVTIDRAAAIRHAKSVDKQNSIDADDDKHGQWETSGIVDASHILGDGAWLCTVQAHGLRIAPVDEIVEGGQVLVITY